MPYTADAEEAAEIAVKRIRAVAPDVGIHSAQIAKRSVDARRRGDIRFIWSVAVDASVVGAADVGKLTSESSISEVGDDGLDICFGEEQLPCRPVVIGFGPAGIFASLLLAEYGYAPLVLERGGDVSARVRAVERFYDTGVLDTSTNIQFGAGGAGTFSDGKLTTRIGDSRCSYVLKALHSLGAPEDILINAKPHIGTDVLRGVVENAAARLVSLGGEIRYNTRVSDIPVGSGHVSALKTDGGDVECGPVVLAIGHSARDTYSMIIKNGFETVPKPFSMGFRIEHLQSDIDKAMFGSCAGDPRLPHAEYALSRRYGDRGVYTFCMCPGGEVVAAASEEGGLVVNGMSGCKRDGRNANSAVAVSLDVLSSPEAQIELQRRYERAAFAAGGGNYYAPVQTLGDFMKGGSAHEPRRIYPTYMGGTRQAPKTVCADVSGIISDVLGERNLSLMRDALTFFGRRISGFDCPDAVIIGVESRTSAPLRILRGEAFTSDAADNLYPCGEGAGYAGGIMSAAVDGIRVAQAIMARYKPPKL